MTSHCCNPLPGCQHDHHNAPGLCRSLGPGLRQADNFLEGELLGNPDDEVMDWDASASMSALLTSKPGLRWLLLAVPTALHETQTEIWEMIDDDIVGVRNVGVQTEENFNTDEAKDPWEELHEDVFYDCKSDWDTEEDV